MVKFLDIPLMPSSQNRNALIGTRMFVSLIEVSGNNCATIGDRSTAVVTVVSDDDNHATASDNAEQQLSRLVPLFLRGSLSEPDLSFAASAQIPEPLPEPEPVPERHRAATVAALDYRPTFCLPSIEEEHQETHLAPCYSLPNLQLSLAAALNERRSSRLPNEALSTASVKVSSVWEEGRRSWREQLFAASSVNAGDTANATMGDLVTHVITFPLKVLCSLIPPPVFLSGWLCFFASLMMIAILTTFIVDLASIFGCLVGLKDVVTAVIFCAAGTSLPDTFASRIAAISDDSADNAIGNITGSNAINVFLGLGLPWLIASIYHAMRGQKFVVHAGNVGFNVALFCITGLLAFGLFGLRRHLNAFGRAELGGPAGSKMSCVIFLLLLYAVYISLTTLQAYDYVPSL